MKHIFICKSLRENTSISIHSKKTIIIERNNLGYSFRCEHKIFYPFFPIFLSIFMQKYDILKQKRVPKEKKRKRKKAFLIKKMWL